MDLETSIGFPDCLVDIVWAHSVYVFLELNYDRPPRHLQRFMGQNPRFSG